MERSKVVSQYIAELDSICIPSEALHLVKVIGEGMRIIFL